MIHGGDILSYQNKEGEEIIDYSSNINPLGPPQGLYERLIEGFSSLNSYPDIHYRKLKKAVAQYLKCQSDQLILGNGAVEIIDKFIMQSQRVLSFRPAFIEYELRAKAHKKEWSYLNYDEDFKVDLKSLADKLKEEDLLVLANPNNPTGLRIGEEKIKGIYKLVLEKKAYLLLDEAFYEFAPLDYDSIEIFRQRGYERLAIIRAATKFFSLPGLRLGYACTEKSKVKEIAEIELPWSVNSLADLAGQFIFQDQAYIDESRDYIDRERKFVYENLLKIEGLRPYKTDSNYMLIKLDRWNEEEVFNHFLEKGILIRKCSSFPGLEGDHIRIAIKDRVNNEKLIDRFKQLK